jgi:acetolactate synthase-1/2/3 large subunit
LGDLLVHSWAADYQRLQPVDLNLVGETRVALPALAALLEPSGDAHADRQARAQRLGAESATRRATWEARARAHAQSPTISTAYLAVALRDALEGHDWVLSNSDLRGWTRRLWRVEAPYQYTGPAGGAGVGYGIGASLGVGLAHAGTRRIVVDIQPDGDLLYCSSALWTAARERLPLLIVMWNNRSYYNSEEHALHMAEQRGRPADRAGIGTQPVEPYVDFATVARGFGLAAGGPITTPTELPAALARAIEVVAAGQPYLLDVVTEPR